MTYNDFMTHQTAAAAKFVRAALVRNRWVLSYAARDLEIYPSKLSRLINELGLSTEYSTKNRGRGRPPKK